MSDLRLILITVFYLTEVYSIAIPCEQKKLVNCTCIGLQQNEFFVSCRNSGIDIQDACEICSSIDNVTKIDLSFNNISTIPNYCFENCTKVSWLSLCSNKIKMLEKKSFASMTQLKYLNLDWNFLIEQGNVTTPEAFDSLTRLQSLSLKSNNYNETETESYRYLPNISNKTFTELQKLSLDGLPNGVFGQNFENYKKLVNIDLSGIHGNCNIIRLTNESFRNVVHVTHLNISKCKISMIEAGTFEPLSQLCNLNLSHNLELGFVTLRNVSYGLQNTSIEVLDYSKVYKTFGTTNQLKRCDIWYLNNTRLKEIRLNSNRMDGIEVNGMHLVPASLEVFWAENNPWDYGPFIFQTGCVNKLERIEASKKLFGPDLNDYNSELKIKEKLRIDTGTEECIVPEESKRENCLSLDGKKLDPMKVRVSKSLKRITMSRSNLYFKIPDSSTKYPIRNAVEYIDLSSNVLYQWRGKFLNFGKLKYLDLSNNFCSYTTEDFFMNAPDLETLNISKNNLGLILAADTKGLIFKPLQKLEELDLAQNDIENLPTNVFAHLKSLKTLNISYNRIQKINFDFSHMTNLSKLDIQQNKIYSLPMALLQQMENYSKRKATNISIDMSKNLIHLSCKYLDFLQWMSDHTKYFKNIETYQFQEKDGSISLFSKFRPALETLKNSCRSYTPIYVVSAISVTAFVAILVGGFIYRFRWRLRYFYYLAKAKYTGYMPLRDSESETFLFDAFVSYANEDGDFVKNEMVKKLEEEFGLRLCIHERDFTPGRYIAENILQAITNSRRTIILLSTNFLTSKWCRYEFNMARMEGIYSRIGENILFIIMYEEVDMTMLSHEMLECLQTESYLKYQDDESETPFFWETLNQGLINQHQ